MVADGLEAARRSEVAKSFRYARAFYDEAEAAGPAEFERNRQAIIDVIALAYRDGRASARAGESALRAAAREVMKSYEAYVALGSEPGIDSAGSPPKPEDQWDEYDYMMIPAWRRLKAALDGAPWEPSEEQVERAAKAIERWDADDHPYGVMARAALKAAMGSATTT